MIVTMKEMVSFITSSVHVSIYVFILEIVAELLWEQVINWVLELDRMRPGHSLRKLLASLSSNFCYQKNVNSSALWMPEI